MNATIALSQSEVEHVSEEATSNVIEQPPQTAQSKVEYVCEKMTSDKVEQPPQSAQSNVEHLNKEAISSEVEQSHETYANKSRRRSSMKMKKNTFPYEEQVDLFQFASTMSEPNRSLQEIFCLCIQRIYRDLSPSGCSIFFSDDNKDDMKEFRIDGDNRTMPLRKMPRANVCFGTPSANCTQHLVYLPRVSSSPYEQQDFLPRDNANDLLESVIYVSIFDARFDQRLPIASIETSSRQVHAFRNQQQLYIRTIALILGQSINSSKNRSRLLEVEVISEVHELLSHGSTISFQDQFLQIFEQKVQNVLPCEAMCLYLYNDEDKELTKLVEAGAHFSEKSIQVGVGFEGSVAKNKVSICVDDAENDQRFNKSRIPCHLDKIETVTCVPIFGGGQTLLGVVSCLNRKTSDGKKTSFIEQDKIYLENLAKATSVHLQLYKLEKEKNKERKRAESVHAVMNNMKKIKRNQNNPEEVLKLLTLVSDGLMSVDRASFFAVDDVRQELVCIASKKESILGLKLAIGEGVAGNVALTGRTVNIKDAYSCAQFCRNVDRRTGYRTKNILAMPIRDHRHKIIAVVQLLNKEGGNFDSLDEEIMAIFTEEVAPAIKHVIMEMNECNGRVFKENSVLSRKSLSESPCGRPSTVHRRKKGLTTNNIVIKANSPDVNDNLNIMTLEKLQSWDLDVLDFSKPMLIPLVEQMFIHYDLPAIFDFDTETLRAFIHAVMAGYRGNTFHNYHHAVQVVHSSFLILSVGGADEFLEDRDIFAILFAALIHDLEHTGNNNDFEVRAQTQLALKYNDKSILENHSASCAFRLAKKTELNLFKNFNDDDFGYTRNAIIKIVLGTDMAHHLDVMKKIVDLSDNLDSTSPSPFDVQDADSREFLSCLIVHASDLSNPAHGNFEVVKKWSVRVCEEFSLQAKKEHEMGFPVTAFMDGLESELEIAKLQIGFVNYVALPLWKIMAILLPKTAHLEQNCSRNATNWQSIVDLHKKIEEESTSSSSVTSSVVTDE